MKKKGFTLVELLAVIVILAIISLIAVPTILGVIQKTKRQAAASSALGYVDAVEKYQAISILKGEQSLISGIYNVATSTTINESKYEKINDLISFKGSKPTGGTVGITQNGTVGTATLCFDNYIVEYSNSKAEIISNDCGEIGYLIEYNISTEEWTTQKTLTISYPDVAYDAYMIKLESGKATLNGVEMTIDEEVQVDSREVTVELLENSQITAWMLKDNKKVFERSYEETKIDNVELGEVSASVESGYSKLTFDGIQSVANLTITFEEQEGTSAYYSLDGNNWILYTGVTEVSTQDIKVKLMRDKSGREGEIVTASVSVVTDAITSEAFDGDLETAMIYHSGYNNINYNDKTTWNKYMLVDENVWGMYITVKWYSWDYSGYVAYFDFEDASGNVLDSHSISGGTTTTEDFYIPENTTRIKYYMSNVSHSVWSTNSKMYEIKLSTETKIEFENYLILESTGVSEFIDMEYKNANIQYKIGDADYVDYDDATILKLNDNLHIKATNLYSKEEQIFEYGVQDQKYSVLYDDDDSTRLEPTSQEGYKEIYVKISDEMKGKKVRIKWHDNNSGGNIYHIFLDSSRAEIGSKVQLSNLTLVDKTYDIPENAEYLYFYVNYSCYIYEIDPVNE